ncbi:MAG: hypothetical protein F6K40_23010 [Okeania sp. SIO3I5]|uniref:hypothetical protein n=1 Tax=Okeania sp. SIO3I5 TaxID=2607805 RepID=UPI0013B9E231|nr:hypothetical protein [Okeania sp. SIO3I5]NEQ38981.1 hypothetical protein [Okeania sp. SIO3I5]
MSCYDVLYRFYEAEIVIAQLKAKFQQMREDKKSEIRSQKLISCYDYVLEFENVLTSNGDCCKYSLSQAAIRGLDEISSYFANVSLEAGDRFVQLDLR